MRGRVAVVVTVLGALALVRRGSRAHPDLRVHAALLPREPITPRTLPLIRALTRWTDGFRAVEVIRVDAHVTMRVHRPSTAAATPALLWIHGGGYVLGSASQDDALCRRFARVLGITVAAVDYRLAPEHPYPIPLEDCHTALRALTAAAGVDPTRVAIGGASAGAGLAAALAITARDHGIPLVLQLLAYPMLDDRTGARPCPAPGPGAPNRWRRGIARRDRADHRLWGPASNRFGWRSYLGTADAATAVPARRDDLTGLAPAWIGVGTHDLFHAEDLTYARALRAAGVDCAVLEVPGAFHGFDAVAPRANVSRHFFAAQCAALRAAFTR